jgi:hypothetical protein
MVSWGVGSTNAPRAELMVVVTVGVIALASLPAILEQLSPVLKVLAEGRGDRTREEQRRKRETLLIEGCGDKVVTIRDGVDGYVITVRPAFAPNGARTMRQTRHSDEQGAKDGQAVVGGGKP